MKYKNTINAKSYILTESLEDEVCNVSRSCHGNDHPTNSRLGDNRIRSLMICFVTWLIRTINHMLP